MSTKTSKYTPEERKSHMVEAYKVFQNGSIDDATRFLVRKGYSKVAAELMVYDAIDNAYDIAIGSWM